MSTTYKFLNQKGIFFVSFATFGWVDVFTRIAYKGIFVESLRYCINNKGIILHAWCLMKNYVHLIYSSKESGKHSANLRGSTGEFNKYKVYFKNHM
jgi:putative transposase